MNKLGKILLSVVLVSTTVLQAEEKLSTESLNRLIEKCSSNKNACDEAETKYEYGVALIINGVDHQNGWALVEEAADTGFLDAVYFNIERYYRQLDGKDPNNTKLEYYAGFARKLLDEKDIEDWTRRDYINSSFLYEKGLGGKQDLERAFQITYEASMQGYNNATLQLVRMYSRGIGTEVDIQRAKSILKTLKDSGYVKSKDGVLVTD